VPSCLLEPLGDQFAALLPARGEFVADHPLGCHRRRIADRTVFEHIMLALVHGSGYERISTAGCSDRTIRRRVDEWAGLGIFEKVHALALEAYDRMIGLGLGEISVAGCITKAPSGDDKAGRSPVDRGKQGLKRSVASDACGVPLGIVSDRANRHDSPLLGPTLEAAKEQVGPLPDAVNVSLDGGYDIAKSCALIAELGFTAEIARKGVPAPAPGRQALGGRAHALVDERLRQAPALHREERRGRGPLPLPRRRSRHAPLAHPPSNEPLPLAQPPHQPAPQMIHLPVGLSHGNGRRPARGPGRSRGHGVASC
jgi:hypothetical protein